MSPQIDVQQLSGCYRVNNTGLINANNINSSTSEATIDECDVITSERTFSIYTTNYPSKYRGGIDCTTTILKADPSVNRQIFIYNLNELDLMYCPILSIFLQTTLEKLRKFS